MTTVATLKLRDRRYGMPRIGARKMELGRNEGLPLLCMEYLDCTQPAAAWTGDMQMCREHWREWWLVYGKSKSRRKAGQ